MADKIISQLPQLTNTTVQSTDMFPIYDVSALNTKYITLGDLNKSVTGVVDSVFEIVDNADSTKKMKFELSGLTTATTRTLTVPDSSTTLVGIDTTQTLTNKTINPSLNTIDGDVLDVTFTPVNYVPTLTGAPEAADTDDLAAHLKGIDNALVANLKQIWVPVSSVGGTLSNIGNFPALARSLGQVAYLSFFVPTGFVSLVSCLVVVVPTATTTVSFTAGYTVGAAGENNSNHSFAAGSTFIGTNNVISAVNITSLFGSVLNAGDYAGISFVNNQSGVTLNVIGLLFRYA